MQDAIMWEAAGALIVAGVLAQMTLDLCKNLLRVRGRVRQETLDVHRLETELETLRDLRRRRAECALPWNGFRKFVVARKVLETEGICSFYLSPHDGRTLPDFFPGQYLTFQLTVPGQDKSLVRCYSLSDGPRPKSFRVTIKRVPSPDDTAPAGQASGFFHDGVNEGDILDVKAPSGNFYLDPAGGGGVVLIGGGIGITPVLAMLNTLIARGSTREIHLFYGMRGRAECVMKEHLEATAREHPNVHLHLCASNPGPEEQPGIDFHHPARVTVDLFKETLPSSNFDFYICGPGPMMQSLTDGLKEWGVPANKVHFETFGPSSVKRVAAAAPVEGAAQAGFSVQFKKSGKTVRWTGEQSNLLDLAEAHGVEIGSGCRAGSCGTCRVAVFSGEVAYSEKEGYEAEAGTRLTCIGVPKSDLVMDA